MAMFIMFLSRGQSWQRQRQYRGNGNRA